MQSENLILADVIVVTAAATVKKQSCDAYFVMNVLGVGEEGDPWKTPRSR